MALDRRIAPSVSDELMAKVMASKPGDWSYPIRQYEDDVASGAITFDETGYAVDNHGDRWLNDNLIRHLWPPDIGAKVT